MNGIAGLSDVVAIERNGPTLLTSTYEMIRQAAAAHADAPALSFFLRAQDHDRPLTWDYATLFAKITATANLFHSLGVCKDDVIAFVLPNLPQTHLTIWGGQATGIVFAINPLLEPAAIGELLKASAAKVLVTLAPLPGSDLWPKLQSVIGDAPGLQHLVLIDLAQHLPTASGRPAVVAQRLEVDAGRIAVHDFAGGIGNQPTDRLVSGRVITPGDLSSFFCTGGTTARRRSRCAAMPTRWPTRGAWARSWAKG